MSVKTEEEAGSQETRWIAVGPEADISNTSRLLLFRCRRIVGLLFLKIFDPNF